MQIARYVVPAYRSKRLVQRTIYLGDDTQIHRNTFFVYLAKPKSNQPLTRGRITVMTSSDKKKLVGTNAAIWTVAILAAFILPFIAESLSDGSAKLLQVICFAFPLFVGMAISSVVISKSIVEIEN
jgi:hypothetical protein